MLKKLPLPITVLLLLLIVWLIIKPIDVDTQTSETKTLKDVSNTKVENTKVQRTETHLIEASTSKDELSSDDGISAHRQIANSNKLQEDTLNDKNETSIPFEKQTIDYEWAYSTENAISDVFAIHDYLNGIALENIECRTSTCQLRIVKSDKKRKNQDSLDDLYQVSLVHSALDDMGIEMSKGLKLGIHEDNGAIVFFLHDPNYR